MPLGVIKWFDNKKGFGFILGPDGTRDIFVHYSAIEGGGFRSLKDGEEVDYELVDSDKGPQARSVRHRAGADCDAEAGSTSPGSDAQ